MEFTTSIYQIMGVLGFILYMMSYFLLQIGKLRGSSNSYILMNLSAASLVLISLTQHFNLASALIQISWILISFIGLFRLNILRTTPNN